MNPFLIGNAMLTLCAGLWYIATGAYKLGALQLTFTVSNIILLTL